MLLGKAEQVMDFWYIKTEMQRKMSEQCIQERFNDD